MSNEPLIVINRLCTQTRSNRRVHRGAAELRVRPRVRRDRVGARSQRSRMPSGRPSRAPIVGAEPVARHVVFLREKVWGEHRRLEIATVNGETGLCIRDGGRLTAVITIATDGQRI